MAPEELDQGTHFDIRVLHNRYIEDEFFDNEIDLMGPTW